jgi:hypothetical protein
MRLDHEFALLIPHAAVLESSAELITDIPIVEHNHPASGDDLFQDVFLMEPAENRPGPHLIALGNFVSLFLQWHQSSVLGAPGPSLNEDGPDHNGFSMPSRFFLYDAR